LLQGAGHPSQIAYSQIRNRLAHLLRQGAGAARDGSELVLCSTAGVAGAVASASARASRASRSEYVTYDAGGLG
jgi:hypothetical protein